MNHIPVLLDEVLNTVGARRDAPLHNRTIVDCTFGAGGYSRAFLDAGATVIAFDRDTSVSAIAEKLSKEFPGKFQFINAPFSEISELTGQYDAIVFDLGVSSMQIDTPERGFSFRYDAPLDMRMGTISGESRLPPVGGEWRANASRGGASTEKINNENNNTKKPPLPGYAGTPPLRGGDATPTAAELIENSSVAELAEILRDYGDVKKAGPIARAMREKLPQTTFELRDLIFNPHDIAPVFQALRIAVNDEMGEIERALAAVPDLLAPHGVCAVVTFHSIEDRLVKNTFREWTTAPGDPRLPTTQNTNAKFKLLKTFTPTDAELAANPRARSAHLRAAEKV